MATRPKSSKVVTRAGRPKPPNAGKGRKKGVPNKTTASAKQAFALAFDGIGGAKALQVWAAENQTEFYKLFARLIPTEVTGKDGDPIAHTVTQVWQFGEKRV